MLWNTGTVPAVFFRSKTRNDTTSPVWLRPPFVQISDWTMLSGLFVSRCTLSRTWARVWETKRGRDTRSRCRTCSCRRAVPGKLQAVHAPVSRVEERLEAMEPHCTTIRVFRAVAEARCGRDTLSTTPHHVRRAFSLPASRCGIAWRFCFWFCALVIMSELALGERLRMKKKTLFRSDLDLVFEACGRGRRGGEDRGFTLADERVFVGKFEFDPSGVVLCCTLVVDTTGSACNEFSRTTLCRAKVCGLRCDQHKTQPAFVTFLRFHSASLRGRHVFFMANATVAAFVWRTPVHSHTAPTSSTSMLCLSLCRWVSFSTMVTGWSVHGQERWCKVLWNRSGVTCDSLSRVDRLAQVARGFIVVWRTLAW